MRGDDNNEWLPRTRAEAKATGNNRYFTCKPCKRGHVEPRYTGCGGCIACALEDSKKWQKRNPEKVKITIANWREANPERDKEYGSRYRKENPKSVKEASTKWKAENPDKVKAYTAYYSAAFPEKIKDQRRSSYQKRQATPRGKLENAIRARVSSGLRRGTKTGRNTFDLLGYTVDELRAHLENQFEPGMSWDNYGKNGWEIDHIIPLSAHNYETPDDIDFKKAWALSNLQPLWRQENQSKKDKLVAPFQPSLALAINDNNHPTNSLTYRS